MPRSKHTKSSEQAVSASPEQPKKKARRQAAGPRGQSQSCHQCRQSIHSSKGVSEVKTGKERLKCSTCTRFWCEQCLLNRYGLLRKELADPSLWSCPVCLHTCNCSLCRKKAGKLATGILTPLVKSSGFDSVSEFLDKGTDDIAKVLQWQSPELTSASAAATTSDGRKKKQRPDSGTVKSEPPATKRKRRKTSNTENSRSLANGSSPPSSSSSSSSSSNPYPPAPVITAANEEATNAEVVAGQRPKRRKLSHPTHSISFDEDEDYRGLLDGATATVKEPHTTGGQSSTNETSTPAKMKKVSARVQSSLTRVKTPPPVGVRRSSRQRSSTQHYTAPPTGLRSSPHTPHTPHTPHSLTPHTLTPHRDKGGSVSVDSPTPTIDHSETQSPLTTPPPSSSPIKPLASPPENIAPDFRSEKKLELVTLIESRTELLRRNKLAIQLKDKEDRNRKREEIHAAREELKIKAIEEKERERTETKAARAKVLLAQSVLKEARRDRRLRQRERERVGKQAELHALKERRVAEKLQRRELAATPLLENSPKVQLLDAGLEESTFHSASPLPLLSPLNLPVSMEMFPRLLFVAEFLNTFASALNLKRQFTARDLCTLLTSGRGIGDVYLQLLQTVVEDGDAIRRELGPAKRQRELERIAKQYLLQCGQNGFAVAGEVTALEDSLVILEHLCEEALLTSAIDGCMEAARDKCDALKKDYKTALKSKTKQISDELKRLCEGGGSVEDIQLRREGYLVQLREMACATEREQHCSSLPLRNSCLGQDRNDRYYWLLKVVPGVVVQDGEGWLAVDSAAVLAELMEALCVSSAREKVLLDALSFHKETILASLSRSDKVGSQVVKFYGGL